ncbi:hypothetical protein MMC25_002535 [Agyrium rufum]|nr:hypothetical protein [Agyrium rufum]
MAFNTQHIQLARALPPKLLRFFTRYPPQALGAPTSSSITTASNTSSSDPNAQVTEIADTSIPSVGSINPFQSQKHPITGNWHDPIFSLRRQADLVKLARAYGVEELLPQTTKGTLDKLSKREKFGLRVRGTGVGQRVKGKLHERTMKAKLEKRRQAMLEMPEMVRSWKQRGHGRGWKKFPK